MEALDGCLLRSSSALDNAKCEAAARAFTRKTNAIFRYWSTSVELSGGIESTKNRNE
jgi:hypothetical protein